MAVAERGLLGRSLELAAFGELLSALERRASGGILQVAGDLGIGKTRLLAEFQRLAETRHCLWLSGRASELEADLPFGIFVDALDDHLTGLGPARLASLEAQWVPELATVFPAFVHLAGNGEAAQQAERHRTYRAVRALLEELSRSQPAVVAFDDAHWCDPASLELLSYLLAHPVSAPVLVVVAFRPVSTPARLLAAMAAAVRAGHARRQDLRPLSRLEAEQLAGPGFDPETRAELYRQSEGNPFYLEQLARSVDFDPAEGRLSQLGLAEDAVPTPVATALTSELASLPDAARTLLEGAAVAGDPFETDLVFHLVGVAEGEGLELFDTLVRRDLVRATSVPRRFRFRHPMVRRAVYESTGAGWRLGAHARAAAALTALGTPPSGVAHHVEHSAKPGDEDAVAVLTQAGDGTAPRAPATAARWYGAAIRLLPQYDPRRLELVIARATALAAAGQLGESHAAFSDALERLPPGHVEGRATLTAVTAGVEMLMGRLPQARQRLLAALDGLVEKESAEAAALQVELSVFGLYTGDYVHVRRWAEEALATSRRLGERALEAVAASLQACAMASLTVPGAGQCAMGAAALLDDIDDATLSHRIDIALYVGWTEITVDSYERATRHFERGIAVSRATGQGRFIGLLMHGQAVALLLQGRIAKAAELTAAAVDASRLHGSAYLLSWALWGQSWVQIYTGELESAVANAAEAVGLLRDLEPTVITVRATVCLGLALLETGDVRRARRALLNGMGGPQLVQLGRLGRCMAYEALTRAEVMEGDLVAADLWAARAEADSQAAQLELETCFARRARAAVVAAGNDPVRASEAALDAAERAEGAGAPVEAARARVVAGRALARAGQRQRAIAELEAAEQVLAGCGAHGLAAQAAAALSCVGRRNVHVARRPTGAGLASLSERERQIAELVGVGKTNREIAGACYLSEKTVERHLSRTFAKVGVSTRAALAAMIARDEERLHS